MGDLFDSIKKIVTYDAERDFYAKHFPALSTGDLAVRFRPMRRSDIKAIVDIEHQVYQFPWSDNTFRDCLKIGYCCWICERPGSLLAYGILSIAANESHIMNLCVAPVAQQQGFGRRMLEKLMVLASEHRANTILLEVRPSNKEAISLYKKTGFTQIGIRKDYYPANDGREDALMFSRPV